MATDYGMKVKILELRERYKLDGMPEALIQLDRDGVLDLL